MSRPASESPTEHEVYQGTKQNNTTGYRTLNRPAIVPWEKVDAPDVFRKECI